MYKPSPCFKRFHIAGFGYHDGVEVLNQLRVGDVLTLSPEPDNPYDPHAVALFYKDKMLGYIPREDNSDVSLICTFGHTNIFKTRIIAVKPDAAVYEQVEVRIDITDVTKN